MAKKIEEKEDEIEEKEVEESTDELEEIVEKKAKVKKKLVASGTSSKEAQNIIGEIKTPDNPENKEDVLSYFKKLDEKIDRLLKSKESEPELDDEEDEDDDQPEKKAKRRHTNGKGSKSERRDHFGFKY